MTGTSHAQLNTFHFLPLSSNNQLLILYTIVAKKSSIKIIFYLLFSKTEFPQKLDGYGTYTILIKITKHIKLRKCSPQQSLSIFLFFCQKIKRFSNHKKYAP